MGNFGRVTPPGLSRFATKTLNLGMMLAFPPVAAMSRCQWFHVSVLVIAKRLQTYLLGPQLTCFFKPMKIAYQRTSQFSRPFNFPKYLTCSTP
jgi:hypothetical protein